MMGPLVHSDRSLLSDPSIVQRITGQVLFLLVLETATWSAYLPEISTFKNISKGQAYLRDQKLHPTIIYHWHFNRHCIAEKFVDVYFITSTSNETNPCDEVTDKQN